MKNFDSLDKLNFGNDDDKKDKKKTIILVISILLVISIITILVIFLFPKDNKKDNKDKTTIVDKKDKKEDTEKEELEDDQIEMVIDGLDDIVVVDDDEFEKEDEPVEEKPKEEQKTEEKKEDNKESKNNTSTEETKKETNTTSKQKSYAFSYPLDIMNVVVEGGTMKATYKEKQTIFYIDTYLTNTMDDVVANIDTLKEKTIKNYSGNLVLNTNYSYKEISNKMWYTADGTLGDQLFSSGYTPFKEGVAVVTILTKDMKFNEVYEHATMILNSAKLRKQ